MATPAEQIVLIDEKLAGYTVESVNIPEGVPSEARKVQLMTNSTRLLALDELRISHQRRLVRIRELLSRLV